MCESKPVVVRSAANPKIRRLIHLRDNRALRKADRVIVDGWRETTRAVDAGLALCQLYVPQSPIDPTPIFPASAHPSEQLHADPNSEKTTYVSTSLMEKICYGSSPRGVVAEFKRPSRTLDQLNLPKTPLVLVLDRIEKPGNLGAIFRCADAAGIDAVLLCDSADLFNPNSIRNSLGSVFHVPSALGTETELQQFLIDHRIAAIAARVGSSKLLWSIDFHGPLAIIMGSEATGLGDRWRHLGTGQTDRTRIPGVQIPMMGSGDSLNVSASAAVICYEARRQRNL